MKILLIRNDNIGDLICTTPAIEALRKAHKDARIDIVVNSLNECVVRGNPFLNKIYTYTKPKHKKRLFDKICAFFGKVKILLQIWREKYDAVVIFRSSYSPSAAIFALFARSKMVCGVSGKGSLVTHPVKFDAALHEVELCYLCVEPLGARNGGERTLYVPREKDAKFKDFVFFHVSSRVAQNQLDKAKIVQILGFLKANFKDVVVTVEQSKFGREVPEDAGVNFVPTKSMDELASLLWAAKFALTLDGGVAHLAPALGIKTVVIFGKTSVARWAPIYGRARCAVLQSASRVAQDVANEEIYEAVKNI